MSSFFFGAAVANWVGAIFLHIMQGEWMMPAFFAVFFALLALYFELVKIGGRNK